MKKSSIVIAAILASALVASAEDSEKYETFLGYSFVKFNPDTRFFDITRPNPIFSLPSFNSNGGDGQFVYNLNRWKGIGVAFDAGAVTKGTWHNAPIDNTVVNFVAGPRYTFHNESRFRPFVQALFGGAYSTSSARVDILGGTIVTPPVFPPVFVNPNGPLSTRVVASRTGFAMLVGGGLDFKVSKHVSIRPIGADYYLTRLPGVLTGNRIPPEVCALEGLTDCGNRRGANNFRYTAGVNFMFGKE